MRLGIVGLGNVGSTIAYTACLKRLVKEVHVCDTDFNKKIGLCMDLLNPYVSVYHSHLVEIVVNTDVCIIAAGRGQIAGEERLELKEHNEKIIKSIAQKMVGYKGIVLVITNPNETMAQLFKNYSKIKDVYGTGLALDNFRLKSLDSDLYIRSGKHEDGSYENINKDNGTLLHVKSMASLIIARKGYTQYGIGFTVANILRYLNSTRVNYFTLAVPAEDGCENHLCAVGSGLIEVL